jgi:hypothetical protein
MRIIVAGDISHHVDRPGAFETMIAYVIGLIRLGHDVYVFDDVDPKRCFDSQFEQVPFQEWAGKRKLEALLKAYGVWPRCCMIYNGGEETYGLSIDEALCLARSADLLFNTAGQFRNAAILESVRHRAFIDEAPGKPQVWEFEYGIDCGIRNHDSFFSVGLNIGTAASGIPTGGFRWHGIVHPVALDLWPPQFDLDARNFTTISNWAGKQTFNLNGQYSGEKSDSWRNFIGLPELTSQRLEIALNIHPAYEDDIELFRRRGWILSDPSGIRTLDDYRSYIGRSRAEFSIANQRYVEFNTGWTSDRTARYLASGKPALVQSTGFEDSLPTGKGIITFTTPEEALAGVDEINSRYDEHCRAARDIAETYFDSDKVLAQMIERTGV